MPATSRLPAAVLRCADCGYLDRMTIVPINDMKTAIIYTLSLIGTNLWRHSLKSQGALPPQHKQQEHPQTVVLGEKQCAQNVNIDDRNWQIYTLPSKKKCWTTVSKKQNLQ